MPPVAMVMPMWDDLNCQCWFLGRPGACAEVFACRFAPVYRTCPCGGVIDGMVLRLGEKYLPEQKFFVRGGEGGCLEEEI